jgi:hypothetical protein
VTSHRAFNRAQAPISKPPERRTQFQATRNSTRAAAAEVPIEWETPLGEGTAINIP